MLGRDIVGGVIDVQRHGLSLIYLTFDIAVVTLTFKILSGLYFGNCKV